MDPNALSSQITALDNGYNATNTYNNITSQLGIPDARTRVQALQSNLLNTENAIKNVDPNVTARTSGALVTEAQRGALVNMEKAPLTQTYNDQNQAYGTEQSNLNDLMTQANTQAGLATTDYQNKRQSLADQLATAQSQAAAQEAKAEADRQFAESQRQFNVSASQKATAAAPSAAAVKQQDMATTSQNLQSKVGKDGHVSEETWNKALNDWTSAGYSAAEFVKNNIQYINQRYGGYHGFN